MPFQQRSWDGYKTTVHVTPSDSIKEFVEGADKNTVFILAPGEYVSEEWVDVEQNNLQLWAEPAHQGQVVISAGFRIRGAIPFRLTHLDFRTQTDRAVFWNLSGQVFLHGCAGEYTPGTVPWDGQYFCNEFGRISISPSMERHSDWVSSHEHNVGRLAQAKDNAYFRMTPSPNGWCVRFFSGCDKYAIVYLAGSNAFLEDIAAIGPNKWQTALAASQSACVAIARGGEIYLLHNFSPAELRGCRYGVIAQNGSSITFRTTKNGYKIADCYRAFERLSGGKIVLDNSKSVRLERVKYRDPTDNADIIWEGERDED